METISRGQDRVERMPPDGFWESRQGDGLFWGNKEGAHFWVSMI